MQDELNVVLSIYKDKRTDLEIRATPEVYINQKSNPNEVQSWLKAKEFSEGLCNKFKGVSGHQLLTTSRAQCESVCGPTEGRRLFSQLQIQKSVCGVSFSMSCGVCPFFSNRTIYNLFHSWLVPNREKFRVESNFS